MEARLKMVCLGIGVLVSLGAGPRTQNFIVSAEDPVFAEKVAQAAEVYRRELALEWLGRELPPWDYPCPIQVILEPQAHGATSFRFPGAGGERGQPYDWQMEVYGTPERILDSVLPHEITHTILASHFQQRLPRWLDEGACSSVEHISEIRKQEHNLLVFLTTGKGIPFNRMFRMMEYPQDMLPLYAQGFSVVRFLLEQESKPHFVNFVRQGLKTQDWDGAVLEHYGFEDLSDLQLTWNRWVGDGSPRLVDNHEVAQKYIPNMQAEFDDIAEAPRSQPNRQVGLAQGVAPAPLSAPQVVDDSWDNDPYFKRSRGASMKVILSGEPKASDVCRSTLYHEIPARSPDSVWR